MWGFGRVITSKFTFFLMRSVSKSTRQKFKDTDNFGQMYSYEYLIQEQHSEHEPRTWSHFCVINRRLRCDTITESILSLKWGLNALRVRTP